MYIQMFKITDDRSKFDKISCPAVPQEKKVYFIPILIDIIFHSREELERDIQSCRPKEQIEIDQRNVWKYERLLIDLIFDPSPSKKWN